MSTRKAQRSHSSPSSPIGHRASGIGHSLVRLALAFLLVLPAPVSAAPLQVTDTTASIRLRAESRDDQFFRQVLWGDRDITGEWRLRGQTAVVHANFRLDFELQDQRIAGSDPAVFLDVSPMASPFSTFTDAGLRLSGGLRYQYGQHTFRAGRLPIAAAGGRIFGSDEHRLGYRPFGIGWSSAGFSTSDVIYSGATVWAGADEWSSIVGTTVLGLANYAIARPRFTLEGGIVGRRAPSRPLFSGVREVSATPYIFWNWKAGQRLTTEFLGAYQAGKRAFRPRSRGLARQNVLDDSLGLFGRPGIYYSGDPGDRPVRAYFVRTVTAWRLPIRRNPEWSAGFHLASGGGDSVDRSFIPFTFDTHRFFGQAGYFGARNARSVHTALAVPLTAAWSARVAIWRMHVVSPREGLYLESGTLFAPTLYPEVQRKQAHSHDAIREWDAEVRWQPVGTDFSLGLAYSEIRHGAYFRDVIAAGPGHTAPPAQWAAVTLEYRMQ